MTAERALSRRSVLRATGGALAASAVGASGGGVGTVAAQSEPDFGGWFDDVDNYDGVVDKRGEESVTVEVGAQGNGGAFGFGPAAVQVDPGTTVVWEWTGEGGVHNVAAEDGSFGSELVGEAGFTFEHRFDASGVFKYACAPHEAMVMKGAVLVGDAPAAAGGDGGGGGLAGVSGAELVGGGFVAALLSPLAFGLVLLLRGTGDEPERRPSADEAGTAHARR
ncbi:halocyanin domain-containing protein [Halegenticoccus soli]|uniref:halocyanin domain-containing protein n=1 Tax=Halegenticoccus soli TaxID=1985678 RepID=UPI000C6D4951